MDFFFETFGRYLFLVEFVLAWILYNVPYFAGRGWLVFGFTAHGLAGSLHLIFQPSGYGYISDEPFLLSQALRIAGYVAFLVGAYVWWKARAAKAGGHPGLQASEAPDQATSMIARNDSNSISKAEAVRDQVFDYFTEICEEERISAEVFKSPPYSETIWVEVRVQEAMEPNLSLRAHARVTIEAREFHRYEQELAVVVNDSYRTKRYFSVIAFGRDDATAVCRYLAGKAEKLSLRPLRCRTFPWQLWRPKNKIVRVKRALSLAAYLAVAGAALLSIPVLGVLLLLAAAIVWWIVERHKRIFSLTSGKPWQEPRLLVRMDSWQAVVRDLFFYGDEMREELLHQLAAGAEITHQGAVEARDRFHVQEEDIWYPGIDGKVQRRQIVVRLRRAVGFVHLYTYGNDLYVGWDAHINGGTWVEKMMGQGRDRDSGRLVRAYGVGTAWHTPNEYDITDANFLIEWIHSIVTKSVQRALKEHEIDQEIDFTIVREARQGIAGTAKPGKQEQEKGLPRLRRLA